MSQLSGRGTEPGAAGPAGVLVIDSKNWSGRVDVRHGVLRQNGYRRTEACEGVTAAAAAVAALLEPGHRTLVSAIICLVGQPTPTEQPVPVEVTGLSDLRSSVQKRPARLGPPEVQAITEHLRRTLAGQRSPAQATTAALTHAGPAPREPSPGAAAQRRGRVAAGPQAKVTRTTRAATHGRKRPRKRQGSAGTAILKLVAILFLIFVLLPAWLNGIRERIDSTPTRPMPAPTTVVSSAPR